MSVGDGAQFVRQGPFSSEHDHGLHLVRIEKSQQVEERNFSATHGRGMVQEQHAGAGQGDRLYGSFWSVQFTPDNSLFTRRTRGRGMRLHPVR